MRDIKQYCNRGHVRSPDNLRNYACKICAKITDKEMRVKRPEQHAAENLRAYYKRKEALTDKYIVDVLVARGRLKEYRDIFKNCPDLIAIKRSEILLWRAQNAR
jgi:hypothetical protein